MVVELVASRLVGWEASPPVVWAPPWEEEKAWAREVASMVPPWVAWVVPPWAAWVALPSVAWAVFPLAWVALPWAVWAVSPRAWEAAPWVATVMAWEALPLVAWEVSPRAWEVAPEEVAKAWAQVASVVPPSSAVEKVA